MKNSKCLLVPGLTLAAMTAALAGCVEGQQGSNTSQGGSGPLGRSTVTVSAPASKPAATTETKPAASKPVESKPAAAASSGNVVYYPSGRRDDAVLMLERGYPSEVVAGQPFAYTINVTNLSGTTVDNVIVDELLPSNFNYVGSNPTAARNGDVLAFDLGRLGPGQSKTITVNGSAAKVGQIASCANLTYTLPACQTINVIQPALAITKTATPEAMLCDAITYKITVTNTGSGLAKNVKVRDAFPAGVMSSDGKSVWEQVVGDLGAGQSRDFTIAAKASKTGTFANTAEAMADGGLTAKSATVNTVIKQPVLTVDAQCSGNTLIGRTSTCTFVVKNTGDGACNNTILTAPVSAGTSFVSADNGGANNGGNVSWNLGSIPAGGSKTVTMQVRNTGAGTVTCSASVKCDCSNVATDQCTITVQGVPDIGTAVTDDDGVVLVGDNHTFRVEVKNQGQVNLTNTKMVVTLPAGLDFVSSADGKLVGGKVEFNFGTLAPGAIKSSSFVVKATKAGEALVVGDTTCNELKTSVRDDELTNFIDR